MDKKDMEARIILAIGFTIFDAGYDIITFYESDHSTEDDPVIVVVAKVRGEEWILVAHSIYHVHKYLAQALEVPLSLRLQAAMHAFELTGAVPADKRAGRHLTRKCTLEWLMKTENMQSDQTAEMEALGC